MTVLDPIKYSKAVEKKICRGRDRYYLYFGCTPFIGGMSRGFTCGCNFKCAFCLSPFRDFLEGETRFILSSLYKEVRETRGYYSPEEVVEKMVNNEKSKKIDEIAMFDGVKPKRSKYPYIDVGYAEITIGRDHLLGLCEAASKTDYILVVETNGLLLGYETDYAQALAPFKDRIKVRVGVKAASPEMMTRVTGVKGDGVEYIYKAISNLIEAGIIPDVAAVCDPRIYPDSERELMIKKIRDAGFEGEITEEKIFPYYPAYKRFIEAGWDPYILATNGKIEVTGKRIPGTYMIQRFDGEPLVMPDSASKSFILDKFFREMRANFKNTIYKKFDAVVEFNIDGKNGGSWHFTINNGKVVLEKGMAVSPDLSYTMDMETAYECFVIERLDFAHAFLSGKIIMHGDRNIHFEIVEVFDLFNKTVEIANCANLR